MRAGDSAALLATMREEMLDLRRDISVVLTNVFVAISRQPEEARRLIGPPPTTTSVVVVGEGAAQVEQLRGEFLDLRREVAVVMANLLIAAGRPKEEVKGLVMDALKPRASEQMRRPQARANITRFAAHDAGGMTASNDRRTELIEWSQRLKALVFRGTHARLSEFWTALSGPGGMKGYIDRHPEVSAEAARSVIRLAGELFCDWPSEPAEQEQARRQPDPRFEVAESRPGIRGGRLCFKGRSLYFEILWDNLVWDEESGALSFDEIVTDWELPREAAKRAIEIGGQLFSEGLNPNENLPRPGRAPAG